MRVVSLVPERDRDHRRARARGQPRRAFARMQLPARGGGRAGRLGLAHRHGPARERRDRQRRARRARRRPAALRGRRGTARAARARPDRHAGPVRGLRRLERRGQARHPHRRRDACRWIRATSRRSRSRSARSPGTCMLPRRASGSRRPFHHRIDFVHQLVRGLPRQRVFVAEWLDPPFAAGHWVPEMVDLAGGDEVLGRPRERSFATTWDDVARGGPAAHRARALRLRPRAHRERGGQPCPRWARASSPSTATRPTPGPARAWPRESRNSRTCCIPMTSRRRRCRAAN